MAPRARARTSASTHLNAPLRIAIHLTALIGSAACQGQNATAPLPAGGIHVLFVGNSLTYVNDLPGTVAALGELSGDTIRVASSTGPDLALVDHLNGATDALARIRQGGWSFVVLQQGPSTVPINRDSLILWTQWFDPHIKAVKAKPALLMVWPSSDRYAYFDEVRKSYQQAAQAVHGVFIPAGAGWLQASSADASLSLYGSDGYHPSTLGTYVAALVIYERVTGKDCRSLPPRAIADGHDLGVAESAVRKLQEAAHAANALYPAT
jgi:hypothetical protein